MMNKQMALTLVAFAFLGCQAASTTHSSPVAAIDDNKTGLNFFFTASGDAVALRLVINRTSCQGEPVVPLVLVQDIALAVDGHDLDDAFFQLDPGCYDISVEPLTKLGTPSVDCAPQFADQVVIIDGQTTEFGLQLQCEQPPQGGLDVFVPRDADVISARMVIARKPCSSESIEPLTIDRTTESEEPAAAVMNAFFVLPPGCYDLRIDPRQSSGAPSDACTSAEMTDIVIIDGTTTEVGTKFVCQ